MINDQKLDSILSNIIFNEQADLTSIENKLIYSIEQNKTFLRELNEIRKEKDLPSVKPKSGYIKKKHKRVYSPPINPPKRRVKTQHQSRNSSKIAGFHKYDFIFYFLAKIH